MRVLGGAAAVAAALLMLTGCGSQAPRATYTPTVTVAPTTGTPSASPAPTVTRTVSASPTPSSAPTRTSAGGDPNRPSGQCPDSALGVTITIEGDGGGAGSSDYLVIFTNTGGSSCVLRGAPGVSVVAGDDGDQVGPPADRNQSGAATVRLGVGGSATAHLQVTNIRPGGGPLPHCTVKAGRGYRVYPPHSTKAFFAQNDDAAGCVDGPVFMRVGPVQAQ